MFVGCGITTAVQAEEIHMDRESQSELAIKLALFILVNVIRTTSFWET